MENRYYTRLRDLREDYQPPRPYNRSSLNRMSPDEQDIFDAIVAASTRGMSQRDIERIVKKALVVAFDKDTPSILRRGARDYYRN